VQKTGAEAVEQAELEAELGQAERDFASGDFVELTLEQLDRCIAAGEWPWPNESSARSEPPVPVDE
jgi:hypothetical protein